MSRSVPTGGETAGEPVASITSPTFSTISRGSSGLPVACAGQTDVHRPQIVHASVSKSCFHVNSSIVETPNVSSSVSIRFGMGFIAPLGRSLSRRYMFIGDVIMWRSFVVGRMIEEGDERGEVRDPHRAVQVAERRCAPAVEQARQRVADEGPLLVRRGGRSSAMRKPSTMKPGDRDEHEGPEDHGVLGLRLDPDAVGALHVAAARSPRGARRGRRRPRRRPRRRTPGTPCRAGTSGCRASGGRSRGSPSRRTARGTRSRSSSA